MIPLSDVQSQTAAMLGEAVAEVAARAIKPELEPFEKSLAAAVRRVETTAEDAEEALVNATKAITTLQQEFGAALTAANAQRDRHEAAIGRILAQIEQVRPGVAKTHADLATLSHRIEAEAQARARALGAIRRLLVTTLGVLVVVAGVSATALWFAIG